MTRPRGIPSDKIVTLPALLEKLGRERQRGRTVVFTNGCYDLVHGGHLSLLERAAELGDLLVVGLNDDDSVRRLKGGPRPWLPFADRAALLAAFEVVDYVVSFAEDTPAALIEAVVPDVLVKGADWTSDDIVGRDTVQAHGGRVVRVPLVRGRSTSTLVERIRASGRDPEA